jgi:acyl-CoA synthetase (AMP-forming)/AMP-acid ligase II
MTTMRALIERAERHFPANHAMVSLSGDPPLTWAEFAVRIRRAAGALRSLGVDAGDRFAIICRNDPRQTELIHAGYWMGAVPVPINYRLAPAEIAAILEGVSLAVVAVEDHWASLITEPALAGHREAVLWIGGDHGTGPDEPVCEDLRDASPEDCGAVSTADDDALLLYTGGTTGLAKGVRLTHRNIAAPPGSRTFAAGRLDSSDRLFGGVAGRFQASHSG